MKKDNAQGFFDRIFLSTWRPFVWIFAAVALLYAHSLFYGLVYFDDQELIMDNSRAAASPSNIVEAVKQDVFHTLDTDTGRRPILGASFAAENWLGDLTPSLCRGSNILFHAAAALLLLVLLLELGYGRQVSFLFSLLFAVHPALVQSVVWVPGRSESLTAVFVFASFIFFLRYLKNGRLHSAAAHLLCFALALFTNEMALFVPVLAWLYARFAAQRPVRKGIFFGWAAALLCWVIVSHLRPVLAVQYTPQAVLSSLWMNLPATLLYAGSAVFPARLSVLPILRDASLACGLAAVGLLAVLCYVNHERRRYGLLLFGVAWFLLFLVPGFIRPNPRLTAEFLAHRLYLPLAGIIIVFLETGLVRRFGENKKVFPAVCLALAALFAVANVAYSRSFRSGRVFWEKAVLSSPHSPLAHRNLGAMYYMDGLLDKAEEEYRLALALNPAEPMVHNNLGLILMNKHLFKEAEEEYRKELEVNPNYDTACFNLGLLYYRHGKYFEAQNLWKKTIAINFRYADAYNILAMYYYKNNDTAQARYYLEEMRKRGLAIDPALEKLLK